jgi:hypothetical protein
MKRLFNLLSTISIALAAASLWSASGQAQAARTLDPRVNGMVASNSGGPGERASGFASAGSDSTSASEGDPVLPMAPEPAAAGGNNQGGGAPWDATETWGPLSRMSIGADVSPLGIGIKSAVILTQYIDARVMGNFFNYDSGRFELEGFNVDADFHLASMGASVDLYPMNSIWRLSGGLMFYNGNQITAKSEIVPGTSFSLNGQTFYAASANAATGATPLNGSGTLGFHAREPALMVSGGFGRFVPRSKRHWSFPSEFGVIFTGSPTIDVSTAGWVCNDQAQTRCGNIADPANPVGQAFNSNLQTQLAKWRKSLSAVSVYPLFSYSVVYSFNLP